MARHASAWCDLPGDMARLPFRASGRAVELRHRVMDERDERLELGV
jgi:hypothetical protein